VRTAEPSRGDGPQRSSAAQSAAIVRVEDLGAAYDGRAVFEHVSFEVRRGEVLVLLGPSGCGKSTLLRMMIGLQAPAAGRVLFEGEDVARASGAERLRQLRRFGVTFQGGALFGSLDLLGNVRLPLEEHTALEPEARELLARMKLRLVGLGGFERHLPSEISGGMQKRAALARALALDPELVFLDEPGAGLDPLALGALDELVLGLSEALGVTFVVVTHELASVFRIADRVLFLDREARGMVALGPPAELRDASAVPLVRLFLSGGARGERGERR
jgi:phospholipid/cholesterol/gamma-HCH transport system ATP-binding protein